MGELDDDRRLDHILDFGVRADLGAEDNQQWPEPLSTCGDDVLRSLGDHVGVGLGGLEQCGLDLLELGSDRGLKNLVSRLLSQHPSSIYPLPSADEFACLLC